jgi:hypothetical protein
MVLVKHITEATEEIYCVSWHINSKPQLVEHERGGKKDTTQGMIGLYERTDKQGIILSPWPDKVKFSLTSKFILIAVEIMFLSQQKFHKRMTTWATFCFTEW